MYLGKFLEVRAMSWKKDSGCVRACLFENVFALQLHVDGVHVRSDVRQQG